MHGTECDERMAHTESQNCDSGLRDILRVFSEDMQTKLFITCNGNLLEERV